MTPAPPPPATARRRGFLLAYALAYGGGVLSYAPLLGFLLPARIEQMAGEARIGVLSGMMIIGACVASLANIAAGMLSDRSLAAGRGRRGWIAGGLAAACLAYAAIWRAPGPLALMAAVCALQVAINFVLGPLLAIMADEVPDGQKGVAGGLLTLAQPLSMALTVGLVALFRQSEGQAYLLLCAMMVALVAPLLATRAQLLPVPASDAPRAAPPPARGEQLWLGLARLLPQTAMNVLSTYLLYYFEGVAPGVPTATLVWRVSVLSALANALALPVAVAAGRLADRWQRRRPLAQAAAALAAAGLAIMLAAPDAVGAVLGFGLFAVATHTFLGLHAALMVQALPSPRHRGRDLGLQNLANTIPALLGPGLTVALAQGGHFGAVLAVLVPMVAGSVLVLQAVRAA